MERYENIYSKSAYVLSYELLRICFRMDHLFSVGEFNSYFLNILVKLMKEGNFQIKREASKSLTKLLVRNHYLKKRKETLQILKSEFGESSNSYFRLTFLHFCKKALPIISRSFFYEHFLPLIVKMASDKVPNVRIRLSKLIPKIKRKMGNYDPQIQNQLFTILNTLSEDKDSDVQDVRFILSQSLGC
jgi:hypothetical protein